MQKPDISFSRVISDNWYIGLHINTLLLVTFDRETISTWKYEVVVKKLGIQLIRHSPSAFGFHEKWRPATWELFFMLPSIRSYGSLASVKLLETNLYVFLKALMALCHSRWFHISRISTSRNMDREQKWHLPLSSIYASKKPALNKV